MDRCTLTLDISSVFDAYRFACFLLRLRDENISRIKAVQDTARSAIVNDVTQILATHMKPKIEASLQELLSLHGPTFRQYFPSRRYFV